jgi:hypothetical protein
MAIFPALGKVAIVNTNEKEGTEKSNARSSDYGTG